MANLEYLESKAIDEAIKEIKQNADKFKDTIRDVKLSSDILISSWEGEGCAAFEKDYATIFRNLEDVSDIMYGLYDALVETNATFIETDQQVAKKMSMGE